MPLPYKLRELENARRLRALRRANRSDWPFRVVRALAPVFAVALLLAAIFLEIIPRP